MGYKYTHTKENKGFTLIEALVVISIIIILISAGLWSYRKLYTASKYIEEVSKLEYVIRKAKIIAMERSTYIKVRVSGNRLVLEDCGFGRTTCNIIQEIPFNFTLSSTGDVIFSPRGLAHSLKSFCISYDDKSYKVIVNRAGIRTEPGGRC